MKRTSLIWAAMVVAAALPRAADAVNPGQSLSPPATQSSPFNPATVPGQGLDFFGGYGNPNDPFFNSNPYGSIPGGLDNRSVVPNPNPGSYLDNNRSRVTTPGVDPRYAPPSGGQKKWRLGVYSKDLDTGVKIYDVVANGAAYRAGLEVNDLIVAVNGYQVGYVNGQLYDCGTEFQRLADPNGWVTLLVQNNRNAQLVNVPVQLDSSLSTLRGSLALQNRQNLPPNAVANVELKELVGYTGNAVTFASTQINNLNTYPIPFSIDFDPAHISRNGTYVIYASVLVGGREIYRTTQMQRVLDQSPSRPIALQLDQVRSGTGGYPGGGTAQLDENAQVAQIVQWYQQYLGRSPYDRELVNWLESLRSGRSMSQVQLALMTDNQFFNRCDQNKQVYIERMHELMIGRKPTQEELNYWLTRYDAQGGARRDLAREFQGALGIY